MNLGLVQISKIPTGTFELKYIHRIYIVSGFNKILPLLGLKIHCGPSEAVAHITYAQTPSFSGDVTSHHVSVG